MKISQMKEVLNFFHKTKNTPLFIGEHGIGKTSGVEQFTQENNLELRTIRLGQISDAGDLTGLPALVDSITGKTIDFNSATAKDLNTLVTKFIAPEIFPRETEKGKNGGILFLDEINRCPPDLLQAVFQLVENGGMNGYNLPDNWSVVTAMNPPTDDYTVTDFSDQAFQDRFCHIEVVADNDEFIRYIKDKGFESVIPYFLGENPNHIRKGGEVFRIDYVTPSNRSWEKVDQMLKAGLKGGLMEEVLSGFVGFEATNQFLQFKKNHKLTIKGIDVLKNFPKIKDRLPSHSQEHGAMKNTIDDIIDIIGKGDLEINPEIAQNLSKYILAIPRDVGYSLLVKMKGDRKKYLSPFMNEEIKPHFLENDEIFKYLHNEEAFKSV